ncbi:MAG: multiubiquitin domain-containing protein [Chitinophagales bacterium]|nr:multiubiquitin domain-containing protein [Chitinophagales bacterium]
MLSDDQNLQSNETQVVEIELYAKEGKEVPKGCHYIITVDRQKYTVKKECMTGQEILILADKTPHDRFQLNQRFKDGKVAKVGYDQKVCFTEPGIEKFMTIPLDQTEG